MIRHTFIVASTIQSLNRFIFSHNYMVYVEEEWGIKNIQRWILSKGYPDPQEQDVKESSNIPLFFLLLMEEGYIYSISLVEL